MSKENKNETAIVEVNTEPVADNTEVVEEKKVKTVGKKVGKILLGVLAIGGAFFLGTKCGGRNNAVDPDDDFIVYDDPEMEDDE